MVDPIGGPMIEVNKPVDLQDDNTHICTKIDFDTMSNKYLIYLT